MERLRGQAGPILAQFAYVAKGKDAEEYASGPSFLDGCRSFSRSGRGARSRWRCETRLDRVPSLDFLRERGVALALSAYYTMPERDKLFSGPISDRRVSRTPIHRRPQEDGRLVAKLKARASARGLERARRRSHRAR
jgi:hypothetical protein